MKEPPIPVGIRLPLVSSLRPIDLVTICNSGVDLGFSSIWMGDHVLTPDSITSKHPNMPHGTIPFSSEPPWLDPLTALGWISAQLAIPVELGTAVFLLPLRNPILFAKQLSSLSWLTTRGFTLGIGTGWLRDEYDAVGVTFEHRATVAIDAVKTLRTMLTPDGFEYPVGSSGEVADKSFTMRPQLAGPVSILWGGHSKLALRIIARHCDGWLPTKQSIDELKAGLATLRRECETAGREFEALRMVIKPGPGPFPSEGGISASNLEQYAKLGFSQAILELPLEPRGTEECIEVMRTVSAAC